jgi:hypothetical protein
MASEWRLIDTAPKDGTEFDAWTAYGDGYRITNVRWVVRWVRDRWVEVWQHIRDDGFDNQDWGDVQEIITHWMPLPEPPELTTKDTP